MQQHLQRVHLRTARCSQDPGEELNSYSPSGLLPSLPMTPPSLAGHLFHDLSSWEPVLQLTLEREEVGELQAHMSTPQSVFFLMLPHQQPQPAG